VHRHIHDSNQTDGCLAGLALEAVAKDFVPCRLLTKTQMTKLKKACEVPTIIPIMAVTAVAVILLAGCGEFFPDANDLVSIRVSPSNSTLQLSKSQQFMAIGTFGDGSSRDISSDVDWKSSSGKVAPVSSSGIATGNATGTTTITASQGSISGSTNLTVSINGTGLTVSPSSQTISVGQTVQFTVTLNGSSVSGVSWSSSRTTIATIDQDGIATGLAVGTTTITATATISGTQYQGTANLTVQ
jgi:plastocyanin